MSLYILKTNETKLLQLGFEDILNQISEQPKLILSGDCKSVNKIELNIRTEEEGKFSEPEEKVILERDITMYIRFKRELQKDDDGNDMHIDFLMEKFKKEFDSQIELSEVRKKTNSDVNLNS